jgi:glycosyltransferase involved in cell wall biosynthesis
MDRAQPLVSIVTPVHNEAEYLAECVESILAQTYQNWDYTILDNRSTDGSLEIARRYAECDPRIRILENSDFLPAIANHNAAFRRISPNSKYCKVVFGDDWIFPECLERMVAAAESHPTAGIVGAYNLEGRQVTCTGLPYNQTLFSGRDVGRRHLLDHLYVWGSANSLLYRADLVRSRDPFLNEANIHADTEVCFALLKTCDFAFVHQVLTFTRTRSESLTSLSTDMRTDLAGLLKVLLAHAADYLDREELEDCMSLHIDDYYRFLGKHMLFGRKKETWQYHKRELIASGLGFSPVRVVKGALAELGSALANPKRAVKRLFKGTDKKRTGGDSAPQDAAARSSLKSSTESIAPIENWPPNQTVVQRKH